MPHLVREHLWIGNIEDAGKVLEEGSSEFTHILSLLSSPSISFFKKWKSTASIPAKEIRKVYFGESRGGDDCEKEEDGLEESSVSDSEKVLYVVEYAGKDLKLIRMAVPIRDTEKENLLDYLDVCLDFIEESRKQGPVLVHCFAGVSRSAAIITAYLMRSEQLSQEDALESLQQSCHFVCPNDGFLDQLKLFEEMGFKVDHASPTYKRFLLKLLGDSFHQGEKMDISKFGVDPGLQEKNLSPKLEASPIGTVNSTRGYRCKKCRRLIVLQPNVVEHVPGEGETSFGNHRKRSDNKADEFGCSSIFILPLRWMKTALNIRFRYSPTIDFRFRSDLNWYRSGLKLDRNLNSPLHHALIQLALRMTGFSVVEGKMEEGSLSCVQCDARLGSFNWSGSQCSCGSWITPAFQLYKSRLDISTV